MLEELKKQVVKYALQADRSGLCKHRSGNFSVLILKQDMYVLLLLEWIEKK